MKAQLLLSALAAALVAAEELKVDVTHAVECDRKTIKGDKIAMHYHGTLADTGKKFDASELEMLPYWMRLRGDDITDRFLQATTAASLFVSSWALDRSSRGETILSNLYWNGLLTFFSFSK